MDLFAPAPGIADARLHPNFRAIRDQSTPEDRQVLSEWAAGFIDRDNKFVKEFQTTFNSSFWELYLYACLKELGMSADFSFDAPDFIVTTLPPLCIEAAIANNADGHRPEWAQTVEELMGLRLDGIVDEATIRIANAVVSKHKKYQSRYANLAQVTSKPFIVAIASFEQPHSRFQNNHAMIRVLYGFDGPMRVHAPGHSRPTIQAPRQVKTIRKSTGAEVPLGYFTDSRMAEISAVFFSTTATWGKVRALSKDPNPHVLFETLHYNSYGPAPLHVVPLKEQYRETLLDGLHVFHNPYATYPLPWELFQRPGVTQLFYMPDACMPYAEAPHGALLQRMVCTMKSRS